MVAALEGRAIEHVGVALPLGARSVQHQRTVKPLQLGRAPPPHAVAHEGQRLGMAVHLAQNADLLVDQRHAARQGRQSARSPGQRLLLLALLQVQVDDVEVILFVVGNAFQQFLKRQDGRFPIPGALLTLIIQLHRVDQVPVQHGVLRIDLVDAFEQPVGLYVVALLAVKVDLTPPQPPPVGIHLQQFVDEADGAGVVLRDVLDVDQQLLGLDVVVIEVDGLEQVVTRLVVVLPVEPVSAHQVLQVRGEVVLGQTLVEQLLALLPLLFGEIVPDLFGVLFRRHVPRYGVPGRQGQ